MPFNTAMISHPANNFCNASTVRTRRGWTLPRSLALTSLDLALGLQTGKA